MPPRFRALTIAGSDPSGGAGIQADLQTFLALGVSGAAAITAMTAQNAEELLGIEAATPGFAAKQIDAVMREAARTRRFGAIKTGMLYDGEMLEAVVEALERHAHENLVVDPVIVSSTGALLFTPAAVEAYRRRLMPMARLMTPNLPEVEALTGARVATLEEMRSAARELRAMGAEAVLIKGGHLEGAEEAIDLFDDGIRQEVLRGPMLPATNTHGTGCTLSAAIAAYLARGEALADAVAKAKRFTARAIEAGIERGDGLGLDHGWGIEAPEV